MVTGQHARGTEADSFGSGGVVAVDGLEKHYGPVRALAGVSLTVARGEIFGLLGQNGAGKTTLVKILLGMVLPTAGSARLLGRPVGSVAARRTVGYLPEDHRLPEYHTGPSLLDVYGGLQGLSAPVRRQRGAELLASLGLGGRQRLRIRGYSKGMKQRLGLAQALLHRPAVLFLDEPTDGVDPVGRRQIRELLLAERDRGVTIFINSHLLGEVEQLCDRVAIMRKGRIVLAGTVPQLVGRKPSWLVEFDRPPPDGLVVPGARLEAADQPGRFRLSVGEDAAGAAVVAEARLDAFLAAAAASGLALRHLEQERGSLEDVYLGAAQADAPAPAATRGDA
ncbi:MAG: ABC transporter ATP-binding protein [Planctomycetes bacterium]|nr:ABC transporter ATP-binding protein [Planctomycetota bacterium]MBM4056977.1 ABC transporter ATP-binding protein [Planctomycetota bacterium]